MENGKWQMPDSFPDLSAAKGIAIDIETRDDELKSKGPGVRRGSYIVGVAVVTDDKEFKAYYPIAHDEGRNMSAGAVLSWLGGELARPGQAKIGANLLYDFDFLSHAGVEIGGDRWLDVQNAEPLIDENAGGRYNLDALARKYLKKTKLTSELELVCAERGWRGKPQQHIWRLPADVVGPYAIEDAEMSIDILRLQQDALRAEDLYALFKIETYLMPMLLRMRQVGVRVDVEKLDKVLKSFRRRLSRRKKQLSELAGFEVQYWAAASIAAAFDAIGLKYPLTPKTRKPSFTREFLDGHGHDLARLILECRTVDKFIGTFLEGQIRHQVIDGRIHALFNQQRSDEYGTVTGRFSSSHPNMQFMPARDDELGPLCRSMFLPEEGCVWGKADYSQIEFRIFAHYAIGRGSDEFRRRYNDEPDIDYHQWCADEAGISRKHAKTVNFGLLYGMGLASAARNLGMPRDEARAFLDEYHDKLPFVRATLRHAMNAAERRGYVRTILRRRRRFVRWEAADWNLAKKLESSGDREHMAQMVRAALAEASGEDYSAGVRRAGTYKALNAIVQGSSADMLKKAMVDCWRAGLFDVLTPHLTVHDELDVSVPRTDEGEAAFHEMLVLMRDAVPLRVPVVVDAEIGPSWGETER